MVLLLARFARSQDGATAIEYGLIAALIAVALIGSFTALGGGTGSIFGSVQNKVIPILDNAPV